MANLCFGGGRGGNGKEDSLSDREESYCVKIDQKSH